MNDDDRELQISLAELQTDVQLYSTILFGFVAAAFSIILTFEQLYFTTGADLYLLPVFSMTAALFVATFYLAREIDRARKKLAALRKKFIW